MGVMMQAFFWDCPRVDNKEFQWWNTCARASPCAGKSRVHVAVAAAGA